MYEKRVLHQITDFVEPQQVYNKHQSGYRRNHSTATLLSKLYDGIKIARKQSELTMTVFTYYSKAFDTIDLFTLIQKMHSLNFFTDFLYWVFNYLTHAQHFVQIDSNCSSLLTAKYGVPQGSILGPILFNLCVAGMSSITPNSNCIQYADDLTLYRSCKINKKDTCIKELIKDLTLIAKWSIETNLVFDNGKTKFMLIASKQLSVRHKLKDKQLQICCNNTELERVTEWKLLGLTIDENLTLNNHISKILKDSYSHLSILKKLKRYTSQSVRRQLVESLIFSRLDFCNNLFIDLPQYQVRRMIKLQKSCASFVKDKFCSIEDMVSLKWLRVPERIDLTVLKMTFKSVLNERMPSNFQISIKEKKRELRAATETTKLTLTSEFYQICNNTI